MGPRLLPLNDTDTFYRISSKNNNSSLNEDHNTTPLDLSTFQNSKNKRVTLLQCNRKPIENRLSLQGFRKNKNKNKLSLSPNFDPKILKLVPNEHQSSSVKELLAEILQSLDAKIVDQHSSEASRAHFGLDKHKKSRHPVESLTGHTLFRCTTPESVNPGVESVFSAQETSNSSSRSSFLVRDFLRSCGLERYEGLFEEQGIWSELDLQLLDYSDLQFLGVHSHKDRELILTTVSSYLASDKIVLLKWLRMYQLKFLWTPLVRQGIDSLAKLSQHAQKTPSRLMEQLNLKTYGAQKRFKLCCANLEGYIASNHPNTQTNNDNSDQLQNSERPIGINSQSQHATSSSHEKSPTSLVTSSTSSISSVGDNEKEASPGEGRGLKRGSDSSSSRSTHRVCEKTVAVGYWGRPQSLQGATSDFLCVQAALKGDTSPNSLACQLEFMVDSGSDVVTCRPELLHKLGCKLLGKIESRGIHATVEKELYRGYLQLGGLLVPVEVMPEKYESVGSGVMRHFKHYITKDSHFWLMPANSS